MKKINITKKENLIITQDALSSTKNTITVVNSSYVELFKIDFNNDCSEYSFSRNGIVRCGTLKVVGIESTNQTCSIHVSGTYCPICKKIIG